MSSQDIASFIKKSLDNFFDIQINVEHIEISQLSTNYLVFKVFYTTNNNADFSIAKINLFSDAISNILKNSLNIAHATVQVGVAKNA